MIHADDHDPILGIEWKRCSVCYAARSATFAEVAALVGRPDDWEEFIEQMREMAGEHVARLVIVKEAAS